MSHVPNYRNALPTGSQLDGGRFTVADVLGAGGFGVVYRATHRLLGTEHAIKEYLPSAVALREGMTVHPLNSRVAEDYRFGLNSFLEEARKLRRFAGHPNVAQCTDFFRGNGTAYLVMAYEKGLSLAELLSRREAEGRPLDESEIASILLPLLEGLTAVHAQNVLHRDIKPGNIFIRRRDEQPMLLDFGAAKQDFSRHSRTRGAHTDGYAPMELVGNERNLGPWTDVYAIGALMWRMVVGEHPGKVEDRMTARVRGRPDPLRLEPSKLQTPCSGLFLEIVERCLSLEEEDRFQNAAELRAALLWRAKGGGEPHHARPDDEAHVEAKTASPPPPLPEPKRKHVTQARPAAPGVELHTGSPSRSWPLWAAFGLVLCGLGVAIWRAAPEPNNPAQAASGSPEATRTSQEPVEPSIPAGSREGAASASAQKPAARAQGPQPGERIKDCEFCPEMVVIPSGSFTMGSPDHEELRSSDEGPQRMVRVGGFAMGRYEVTFAEYDRFADATSRSKPSDADWGRGRRPVINVSWEDAEAYADWLSQKTGQQYRLPSEAEWEYATRAGSTGPFSFSGVISPQKANYNSTRTYGGSSNDSSSYRRRTVEVDSLPANRWGLHGVHGNVWEWVKDCGNETYIGAPTDGRAWTSGDCDHRVLRGGSWFDYPDWLRSANRDLAPKSSRLHIIGFRVARNL